MVATILERAVEWWVAGGRPTTNDEPLGDDDAFLAPAMGHSRDLDRGERAARPDAEDVDGARKAALHVEGLRGRRRIGGARDAGRRDRVDQHDGPIGEDLELTDVAAAGV